MQLNLRYNFPLLLLVPHIPRSFVQLTNQLNSFLQEFEAMGYDSPRDEILPQNRMESGFKSCSRKLSKSSDCKQISNKANTTKTGRQSDEAKYTYGKPMRKFYWTSFFFYQLGFIFLFHLHIFLYFVTHYHRMNRSFILDLIQQLRL